MEEYKVSEEPHVIGEGIQKIYRFPNGYGASVVMFTVNLPSIGRVAGSYGSLEGLWELATIIFKGNDFTILDDEVHGFLNDADVLALLQEIKEKEAVVYAK